MKKRAAFTMIEVVVVVMILGILAAVALPRFLRTSSAATENTLRQSLKVMRDGIDLYSANNDGALPGQDEVDATFKAELAPYVRNFPVNVFAVDPDKDDVVKFENSGVPLAGKVGGGEGWLYDSTTGEFIANAADVSSDGATLISEF